MSAEPEPDFFALHGAELVSLGGWLGEPRFTVEELYLAFKRRLEAEAYQAKAIELHGDFYRSPL